MGKKHPSLQGPTVPGVTVGHLALWEGATAAAQCMHQHVRPLSLAIIAALAAAAARAAAACRFFFCLR